MSTGLVLSKCIDGFMLACSARRLSQNTIIDYRRTLKKFIAAIGDVNIKSITTRQVSQFLADQPFSEKTVLNYHIGLSALWTWAIKEEYAEKHILRLVDKPRPKKIAIQPFTEIEIKAMFASIARNCDRDRAMIYLMLDCGIRASELVGLERPDIDLARRQIKVLGKGNKERFIPFSARTGSALFKLFTHQEGKPFPINRDSLAGLIQRLGDRAGVANAHPHRFRHTFAIQFLRNGGDAYTLQEILGHTTFEMTRIYLQLAQIDIDAAHRRASPVDNWRL